MITTIITWVIVLPEGEEGAAAGAAHGARPGATGLHDSCDSLYDSLVTAYLRRGAEADQVRGAALNTLPVNTGVVAGLRGCQGVEAELRGQRGQRLTGTRALFSKRGVGLSCELVNRVQGSL